MRIIRCSKCGNTKDFYEEMSVIQRNLFHQGKDGRINKVSTEQDESPIDDSHIYCSVCDEEISEDYHLFLDRYTETLFNKAV